MTALDDIDRYLLSTRRVRLWSGSWPFGNILAGLLNSLDRPPMVVPIYTDARESACLRIGTGSALVIDMNQVRVCHWLNQLFDMTGDDRNETCATAVSVLAANELYTAGLPREAIWLAESIASGVADLQSRLAARDRLAEFRLLVQSTFIATHELAHAVMLSDSRYAHLRDEAVSRLLVELTNRDADDAVGAAFCEQLIALVNSDHKAADEVAADAFAVRVTYEYFQSIAHNTQQAESALDACALVVLHLAFIEALRNEILRYGDWALMRTPTLYGRSASRELKLSLLRVHHIQSAASDIAVESTMTQEQHALISRHQIPLESLFEARSRRRRLAAVVAKHNDDLGRPMLDGLRDLITHLSDYQAAHDGRIGAPSVHANLIARAVLDKILGWSHGAVSNENFLAQSM